MSRWVLDAKFSVYVWTDVPDLTKDLTFAANGSETYYKRALGQLLLWDQVRCKQGAF